MCRTRLRQPATSWWFGFDWWFGFGFEALVEGRLGRTHPPFSTKPPNGSSQDPFGRLGSVFAKAFWELPAVRLREVEI